METALRILQIVGSLALFLFGMKIMGDGLQKAAGPRMQTALGFMTRNRFFAFLTGLGITTVIQSSSATTVFVVSFVNAGLLSLVQAIGVVLGANIGTTATAWIVSFFGFKMDIATLALPAIAIGLPFMFMKKDTRRSLGDIFIGFGILFLGLMFLKNSVPDTSNIKVISHAISSLDLSRLSELGLSIDTFQKLRALDIPALEALSPALRELFHIRSQDLDILRILKVVSDIGALGPISTILFVIVGTIMTFTVQSSSAAMAITLTMASAGWIDLPTAAALCLGENIGTTITAQLAAIGQSRNSRRAAMAHTIFNVIGVIWALLIFPWFLQLIKSIFPDAYTIDPITQLRVLSDDTIPMQLSLFHTLFNSLNAFLFIWFVPQYARLIEKIVPERAVDDGKVYKLKYLSASLQDTPEINILTARTEVGKMAKRVSDMFQLFSTAILAPAKASTTEASIQRIFEAEAYVDQMQEEISAYIAECQKERPSEHTSQNLAHMLKTVDVLESIADSSARLAGLLERARSKKIDFPQSHLDEMVPFLQEVGNALGHVTPRVCNALNEEEFQQLASLEANIDVYRNNLKKQARKRIQSGSNVRMEILWIDMLEELEAMGDYTLEIGRELRAMS